MSFPPSDRVVYKRNPLVQVICQLRFPTILEIGSQDPAEFQSHVRRQYPIYHRDTQPSPLSSRVPREIGDLLGRFGVAMAGPGTHRFANDNETRSISLTPEFVAMTEETYTRWEALRTEIDLMIRTLVEVYETPFFDRVGLRYRDEIRRETLGLETEPWRNLVKPELLGILGVQFLEGAVPEAESNVLCSIEDDVPDGMIRIQQGLVAHPDGHELYRIDADLFVSKRKGAEDVLQILDKLNRTGGNFFRWAITDNLARALQPAPAASTGG